MGSAVAPPRNGLPAPVVGGGELDRAVAADGEDEEVGNVTLGGDAAPAEAYGLDACVGAPEVGNVGKPAAAAGAEPRPNGSLEAVAGGSEPEPGAVAADDPPAMPG